mgnify:CR=1 FL=1
MLFFDEIADWWDEQRLASQDILSEFVAGSDSWWRITLATVVHTSMDIGGGFVDVLRLGEGIKQGGWRGFAKDGLRLLALAGPLARGVRGVSRFLTPNYFPNSGVCAYICATQVMRQTGNRLFATFNDIVAASGRTPGSLTLPEIQALLTTLKADTKLIASATTVDDVARAVGGNPGVAVFGVIYYSPTGARIGHALFAFRDALGRLRIADRTGRVVDSLAKLENIYPGIGKATVQGALLVRNSTMAQAITGGSVLAVGVRPVLLATPEAADKLMDGIRARAGLPPSRIRLSGKPAPAPATKSAPKPAAKKSANPAPHNNGAPPRNGAPATGRTHTVRRGETWLSIATLYTTPNGVPASILAALLREQSMLAGHTQPWEPPKHGTVLAIPN